MHLCRHQQAYDVWKFVCLKRILCTLAVISYCATSNRLWQRTLFLVFASSLPDCNLYPLFVMLLCFQFSLLQLPHSCGAFIHICDGTHSPDRNNLFLLIHYWNYIQLWNFPSYFSACYSDACAFPCSDFCQGEIQVHAWYANHICFNDAHHHSTALLNLQMYVLIE